MSLLDVYKAGIRPPKPVLSLSKGVARGCVSGTFVADAGNAYSRLRSKSLIPAYAVSGI